MSAITWNSVQGGDWSVGTNWEFGLVPGSTDNTQITLPGNYTVSITSDVSAASLAINAIGATLAESSAGSLSLSGGLSLYNGVISLNGANSFGGAVQLIGGVIDEGNGGALGSGDILLSGGELLATTTQTMTTSMAFSGAPTIAAATGQTLSLQGSAQLSGATTLTFGASDEAGTIVWKPTSFQLLGGSPDNLDIRDGELVFGNFDEGLTALSSAWNSADIETGATLDLSGVPSSFSDLVGGGTLTGSSTSSVTIGGGRFSGNLTGYLNLSITGQVELAGSSTVGGIQIGNGGAFTSLTNDLGGVVDLDTDSDISAAPGASNAYFVNDGTVLRNGIGGSSIVSVPFYNYGAMRITTGSVTFTDGFVNSGTVEGLLTANGDGTTTWTPDPAETGSTVSGILWQNTDGQASVWALNGTDVTGGGTAGPNPGPSWKAIGTGDFNDDGLSDILWQNTDGQASIWEMNGATRIGGGAVSVNPGPSWKAIGTGNFNGDGYSDILWQNANGQVSIWEMNGATRVGGGAVSVNPGPSWKAIGTGDFNGDGLSDILFQNTSTGQVSIWEMNGNTRIGGGPVSANPGPAWKAVGTGDFTQDGRSDILFQNASTGQVSIWEMNGNNVIGGGAVSVNPGPSWHAIGTAGEGSSDILFQNTNGQTAIWDMSGTNVVGGGPIGANPGPSWRAVGLT
jgi:FG-GAP-like repeat